MRPATPPTPHAPRTRAGAGTRQRTRAPAAGVALVLALVALTSTPAMAATGSPGCPAGSDSPSRVEVDLDPDGEVRTATRTVPALGPLCDQEHDGALPVGISILHRAADGRIVEGRDLTAERDRLRTEVRVRDLTRATHRFPVTGPRGTEVVEREHGIPMMVVVTVVYPDGWRVTGPEGPGRSIHARGDRVEVSYAGLLFPPITAGERVLTVDAVPAGGTPGVTVQVAPVRDGAELEFATDLLDEDSVAVLAAFTELVADGTDELAEGTEELADGTRELAEGTRELADGTAELADGTRELADGTAELADGTRELAEGTGELADGFEELADGFEEFADGIDALAAAAPDLVAGAEGVAGGVAGLVDLLDQVVHGGSDLPVSLDDVGTTGGQALTEVTAVQAALDSLDDALRTFLEDHVVLDLATLDPNDPLQADAGDLLDELDGAASQADDSRQQLTTLAGQIATLSAILDTLLTDPDELAGFPAMAAQFASGIEDLAKGLEGLAEGAEAFEEATGELKEGTRELADGTDELADGTAELADGTTELADGTAELADGTAELADGTDELADGTAELAEGTAEFPDLMREILDIADRSGQRAATTRALITSGAQAAADAEHLDVVLASSGTDPFTLSLPLALAGLAAGLGTAGTLGIRRVGGPGVLRRLSQALRAGPGSAP